MTRVPKQQDLPARLKEIESQLKSLETASPLRSASIGEGGLVVRDGGSITVIGGDIDVQEDGSLTVRGGDILITEGGDISVQGGGGVQIQDGGDLTIEGGGHLDLLGESPIRWFGNAGNLRIQLGRVDPQGAPGGDRMRLVYYDTSGDDRVVIGEIVDAGTGALNGHGVLVEYGNGNDVASLRNGQIYLGRQDGSSVLIHEFSSGHDDLWLQRSNGESALELTGQSGNRNGVIWGGAANGTTALREMIKFMGGDTNPREIRFRDGADSSYIDIAASAFIVRSSSVETKDLIGDPKPGAAKRVASTPVRTWRYKEAGSDGRENRETGRMEKIPSSKPDRERMGPIAEEARASCPEIVNDEDEGSGIDLAASVWTLWKAVQEQQELIEELRAKVDAMEGTTR